MTKHVNNCKNSIIIPKCQLLNSALILKYNTISLLDFLLNNNKENISLRILNNDKKNIGQLDINNNKKDLKLADMIKQKVATPN